MSMVILSLSFAGWYLLVWLPTSSAGEQLLLEERFDSLLPGEFGRAVLAHRHTELADGKGTEDSKAVRVNYLGFERGSRRVVVTSPLTAAEEATLSFAVKFCPEFDFARGGKLHGLGSARPVAGGNPVTDDRWSARLMWRREGGLMTYVYHQDMRGRYGDTKSAGSFRFTPGQYHRIDMTVRLNTLPDLADGEITVQVDGKPVIRHQALRFRSTAASEGLIRSIMFNTFHGGSSPEWAPRTAEGDFKQDCAYFDDFVVRQTVALP
ncbi:polysaccharide lyase [Alkalimonas delamerensis]